MSDYKVGFRRPPLETRFKPGHSGNAKGRPKGIKNLKTELEEELSELIRVIPTRFQTPCIPISWREPSVYSTPAWCPG